MKYLILPEIIYMGFLCGGIVVSLVSALMFIRGIIKKSERAYFKKWSIILLAALVVVALTITGVVVAETMIGG